MWHTFRQAIYSAIIGLILIFLANVLSDGWLLRFLGGFAFTDIKSVEVGSFNSDDIKRAETNWKTIEQTKDESNVKYICYLARVSVTGGGTCVLKQSPDGWQIATNPDQNQQRCVVSCFKIDRRMSPFDFFGTVHGH